MCKCTPTIRTPFCGNGDCVSPAINGEAQAQTKQHVETLVEGIDPSALVLVTQELGLRAHVGEGGDLVHVPNGLRSLLVVWRDDGPAQPDDLLLVRSKGILRKQR